MPGSVEEVRVALALNGGVSLAVWMGGCAVELDCARRAHAGPEDLAFDGFQPVEGGTAVRSVYHGICDAFGRQLVLDILTGASAGGINGALLGAAMRSRRRLHPQFVRDRWIELGDFSRLLQKTTAPAPRSLMQGEIFHRDLVTAFGAVLGTGADGLALKSTLLPPGQGDVEQLIAKLDVMMTDVVGVESAFRDEWGGDLVAREHRACFKFRQAADYTAAEMAVAARTSASFPLAFEPWEVEGKAAALAGLAEPSYGIDGGLLNNAPIRNALDLIPTQGASNKVRRHVCYLNADPPQSTPTPLVSQEPTVKDVVGYVVNLPRVAPFVDQLTAVRDATRRSDLAKLIQPPLLDLDLATLRSTAAALLPAYRARRTALSLDELIDQPTTASAAAERLGSEFRLPWIPGDLNPPEAPAEWEWGVRPAQRIVHLLLDLLRPAVDEASDEETLATLLEVRGVLDDQLLGLEAIAARMVASSAVAGTLEQLGAAGDPAPLVGGLFDIGLPDAEETYYRVVEAVGAFYGLVIAQALGSALWPGRAGEAGLEIGSLFAPDAQLPEVEWSPVQWFLARALAIEVIRRALVAEADVETAQPLGFAQLTPSAPTPILAMHPLVPEVSPRSPRDKLTGVNLGHFAGFYRRSWRANDFMWGRLDAAARVVEIMLDGPLTAAVDNPGKTLAEAVLPDDAPEAARWLVYEALQDQVPASALGGDGVPGAAALRPLLEAEIAGELESAGPGAGEGGIPFTRTVCIRAAQLEVLRDESEQGSSSPRLELPLADGMRATIEALRAREAAGQTLPMQLDDGAEEVSDLGLRTLTQTGLVTLSAARGAGAPLSKFFGVARAPLQAVSGVVSKRALYRFTVAVAFWAAALYLSMRSATAQAGATPLSNVWSHSVLLSLAALLAVVGVVLVPGLRAVRRVAAGRNALLALAFAAVGGVAAALLARYAGKDLSYTNVIFGTGSEQLPEWLLDIALVVAVGLSAVRLPIVGNFVTSALQRLRGGWWLCGPLIAVSIAVAVLSAWRLAPVVGNSWWQTSIVVLAFAGPLLVVAYLFRPLLARFWARAKDFARAEAS
jgi:predicted acylesterase/phospholipase RssA